ncbi:MAG: DNA repair protein RecN, partial [Oscillospiraceae bacterium]|nr:DNA repair protein RecN [Oscillospiraceae bacterium]
STVDEILAFGRRLQEELDGIEHSDERLAELNAACESKMIDLEKAAAALSEKRKAGALSLQERLGAELRGLEMDKVRFEAEISAAEYGRQGGDTIRFLISTNPGEPLKPLSKTASGGELSRVMLALMSILAGDVDTMVFDEIDSGVSGRAAQRVAERLGRLSKTRQVLCVTHLPQIAAMADHHFHIEKETSGARAVTKAEKLDTPARISEIARIIGGAAVTDVTKKSAAELIEQAELYKKS